MLARWKMMQQPGGCDKQRHYLPNQIAVHHHPSSVCDKEEEEEEENAQSNLYKPSRISPNATLLIRSRHAPDKFQSTTILLFKKIHQKPALIQRAGGPLVGAF